MWISVKYAPSARLDKLILANTRIEEREREEMKWQGLKRRIFSLFAMGVATLLFINHRFDSDTGAWSNYTLRGERNKSKLNVDFVDDGIKSF